MNLRGSTLAPLLTELSDELGLKSVTQTDETVIVVVDGFTIHFILSDDGYDFVAPIIKVADEERIDLAKGIIAGSSIKGALRQLSAGIDQSGLITVRGTRRGLANASEEEIRHRVQDDLSGVVDYQKNLADYFFAEQGLSRSELAVPIRVDDKLIGVLNLEVPEQDASLKRGQGRYQSSTAPKVAALHNDEEIKSLASWDDIVLVSEDEDALLELTPSSLTLLVTPYLAALDEVQRAIDAFLKRGSHKVRIKSISQNSPVNVSLDGAAEATEVVRDLVVPWRREHAKEMAQLQEQEKLIQIENSRAEIQERRARAQKERSEAKKVESETSHERTQAEIERMRLENEKLRLEIEEARINLALTILDKLAPELSEGQRILYAMQLLKPLGVITESPLLIESKQGE